MKEHPKSFRNPLGYWCPPNGATPDYVPTNNFRDFVAYGLLSSYFHKDDLNAIFDRTHIQELRTQFLNTVENAITGYDDILDYGRNVSGKWESPEPHTFLYLPGESNKLMLDWLLAVVDAEGHLGFELWCSGGDATTIWLAEEAVNTNAKRQAALEIITEARKANVVEGIEEGVA